MRDLDCAARVTVKTSIPATSFVNCQGVSNEGAYEILGLMRYNYESPRGTSGSQVRRFLKVGH